MTRKRKSMEFRTLKRLCCDEMGIVDDAEHCWKKHYSVECNARNCPVWARLPDAIDCDECQAGRWLNALATGDVKALLEGKNDERS
ncbi:MAG: hypothetical protein GY854_19715 [Deltaproteobacteria bacterium]|nr:hypothetical protein [Deltaproteobacteria bacterium]